MSGSVKISKRSVDAIQATGKRLTIMDSVLKGFCVRVSASGSKSYGYRYRVGGGRSGRQRWLTIGVHGKITADQARDVVKGWAADVAKGGDPAKDRDERRSAPNMNELMDRYLADHVLKHNKPKTQNDVRRQIESYVRPALGNVKVNEIDRADIAKLHTSMSDTPYAANRVIALLSKAFELAEIWGYRSDGTNPCRKIARYREKGRERYLSANEFKVLGEVLERAETSVLELEGRRHPVRVNPQAILAFRLVILTGARISEILDLRWEWINWEACRAELPDSKSGSKHLIFPAPALELLQQLERPESGTGFVVNGGRLGSDPELRLTNYKDPWSLIRAAAGLDDVRVHDLRHSFASVGVSGGMSLAMIGSLLGHRNPTTTARYAHLADDPKQAAAKFISNQIKASLDTGNQIAEVISIQTNR